LNVERTQEVYPFELVRRTSNAEPRTLDVKRRRRMNLSRFNLTGLIWKEEYGYVSKCPELGVASAGDTIEEALANLKKP
jgi:hypothetical protein